MRLQIVKQPNRRWAIFDTGSDTLWLINKTKKEIVRILGERAKRNAEEEAQKEIDAIMNGKDPYYGGVNWVQAVRDHNRNTNPKSRISIKSKK